MTMPRLLFYCQHSLGMGHLVRSLALARALVHHFAVTLVSGGEIPAGLPLPPTVRLVALPPVGMSDDGTLVSRDPAFSLEHALDRRRVVLNETWSALAPDVVLVELYPFGRRKFAGELQPMLEASRTIGDRRPLIYCSVRDLLVGREDRQRKHDAWAAATLRCCFDGVLVHSDPTFSRLEDSLAPNTSLPVPVTYTGFVHDAAPRANVAPASVPGSIVVSAGGGIVGGPLFTGAIAAHALLPRATRRPLAVVTGPFLPVSAWNEVCAMARRHDDVTVIRSVPDLAIELRQAAGSISQCGYNTAMDLVSTRVPAEVVPFDDRGENEQMNRARRLAARGLLQVLPAAEMTPRRLAERIVALPAFQPAPAELDLGGAEQTAHWLAARVPSTTAGVGMEMV